MIFIYASVIHELDHSQLRGIHRPSTFFYEGRKLLTQRKGDYEIILKIKQRKNKRKKT